MFCLRAPANQRFGYTEIDRNFQQSHTESIEACTLARACFHLRVVAQKNRYGYVTPGHTKNIALGITCTTNTSVAAARRKHPMHPTRRQCVSASLVRMPCCSVQPKSRERCTADGRGRTNMIHCCCRITKMYLWFTAAAGVAPLTSRRYLGGC